MQLDKIYFEVKNYIDKVDFSKLWKGFEPIKFALYTDDKCFFDGCYIEKTSDFLANTCIVYQGERVAIWNLKGEMDTTILASKIVHEMFHGFHSMQGDCSFVDELDALYNYKYSHLNLDLKLKENHLLCSLSQVFDQKSFEELLEIKKYRSQNFPYEYHYEAYIEQMEGSADYVELMCLKQLSQPLFHQRLLTIMQSIVEVEKMLPIRIACYQTGALLLYILKQNNIVFDDSLVKNSFAESLLLGVSPRECTSKFSTGDAIQKFFAESSKIVENALQKNDVVCDVSCNLLGVNVYNAVHINNYIISYYFVMYGERENSQIKMGNFVIETHENKKLTKIYRF